MDFTLLKAFVTVADRGCYSQAALVLHVSQPALTRRIQKLEASLKVKLFDRTTRQVRLSENGRDFLPKARRLVEDLDAALTAFPQSSKPKESIVRIACISTVATYLLPAVMRSFNLKYPDTRIQIFEDDSELVLKRVNDGQVDFGINPQTEFGSNIRFEPLLNDPYVLACPKDHPLAKEALVSWDEIRPHKCIVAGRQTKHGLLFDLKRVQARGNGSAPMLPGFYEVQRISTSLGLVQAGLGVAVIPRMLANLKLSESLVIRPLVDPALNRSIGIIRRQDSSLPPLSRALYKMIQSSVSEGVRQADPVVESC